MKKVAGRGCAMLLAAAVMFQGVTGMAAGQAEKKENSFRYVDGELAAEEQEPGIQPATEPNMEIEGIDVSEHNKEIDWEKVKAAGVDFAILRCGYGNNEVFQDDLYWERNVSECERLGIPYGVYLYSYAESEAEAVSEADHVLRLLEGHTPSYPVYYDLEDHKIVEHDLASFAKIFCGKILKAGYPVGVYSNLNWWNHYLTDTCFLGWYRWVAEYGLNCNYKGIYHMWQRSSKGRVDGIDGNVDLDYMIGNPADHGVPGDSLFDDVKMGDWFRHAALYAASEGIMTGLSAKTFGPSDVLPRAQFATILYRMCGKPESRYVPVFLDVKENEFYTKAVLWASSENVGIVTGYSDGKFGPADFITREQMIVMMYRYAQYKNADVSAKEDLKQFEDASLVSKFAQKAMQWAVAEGLIRGDNGKINPQGTANRAECATIIMRFTEIVNQRIKESEEKDPVKEDETTGTEGSAEEGSTEIEASVEKEE